MPAAADGSPGHEQLACTVCFVPFDGQRRRPWDIGCGHSFCEACLRQHPRSFRQCPECRARASNPHVNISLLRLVDAHAAGLIQQQPQQEQQRESMQTDQGGSNVRTATAAPGAIIAGSVSVQELLNRGFTQGGHTDAGIVQSLAATGAPGTLAAHQAKIAELRTKMWVYLTPVLGLLYLLSPLDIIPDFLPIVGWLDDVLVIWYIACSLWSVLNQQA